MIENSSNTRIFVDNYYEANILINTANGTIDADLWGNNVKNDYIDNIEIHRGSSTYNGNPTPVLIYDSKQWTIINGTFNYKTGSVSTIIKKFYLKKNETINYKWDAGIVTVIFDGSEVDLTSVTISTKTIFKVFLNNQETTAYTKDGEREKLVFSKGTNLFNNSVTVVYYKTTPTSIGVLNLYFYSPYSRFATQSDLVDGVYQGTASHYTLSSIIISGGTGFNNLRVGMKIRIGSDIREIVSINSDTTLATDSPFSTEFSNQDVYILTAYEMLTINDDVQNNNTLTWNDRLEKQNKIPDKLLSDKISNLSFSYFVDNSFDDTGYYHLVNTMNIKGILNNRFRIVKCSDECVEYYTNCKLYEPQNFNEGSDKSTLNFACQYEYKLTFKNGYEFGEGGYGQGLYGGFTSMEE